MFHVRSRKLQLLVACALAACCVGLAQPGWAQKPGVARQRKLGARRQQAAGQASPAGPNKFANALTIKLDKEIDEHFNDENLPGLVVLYARDGLFAYKRIKGKADVANNVPMTANKICRLNSVSKWVGTILDLKLAEQGKLNLDAKVRAYLPELPEHHTYRVIDVLACRSGVRHYGEATSPQSPNSNWTENDYATARDAIPMFWHDPLAAPVGYYHYSSFAHSIADACAEKAVGKPISQILRSTLSIPYGLPSLAVEELDDSNPARVKFYTVQNGQNVEITPPKKEWIPSGGGIECTPVDLLKLGILLGDGKIISDYNVQKMMKRVDPNDSYALGCSTAVENGYHVMAKNGSAPGSNAYIWLVPERRMVMVVLANRDDAGVTGLGKELRGIILGAEGAKSKLPDLIVEDFQRTAAPRYHDGHLEIPVRFHVVNQGQAGANEKFVNSVRVNGKDRWTGFMDALPGKGAKKTVTAVVKISDPAKLLQGRTLELSAYADAPIAAADTSMPSYGRVKEDSDNNNLAALSVKVPGGLGLTGQKPAVPSASGNRVKQIRRRPLVVQRRLPDLRVHAVKFDRRNPKRVHVVVRNDGKATAKPSKLQLTVRRINRRAAGRKTVAETPSLASGKTAVVSVDATSILPKSVKLEDTTFRLDVDSDGAIDESDEKNNLYWHKQ